MMNRQIGARLASYEKRIPQQHEIKRITLYNRVKKRLKKLSNLVDNGSITFSVKIRSSSNYDYECDTELDGYKSEGWVFVEIERCRDLASNFIQKTVRPFVLIKYNDKEVGRTPVLKATRNPIWYDECYEFPIDDKPGVLILEVWDTRKKQVEHFLGKTSLHLTRIKEELSEFDHRLTFHDDRYDRGSFAILRSTMMRKTQIKTCSPLSTCHNQFKVTNPEPFRRTRDFLHEGEQHLETSFVSSTSFRAMALIISYLLLGVGGFSYAFEDWSIVDSIYFSVVTFTTVGYGDVRPTSNEGKLFSCLFAMLGIGIIGIALGFIGQNLVQAQMMALQKTQRKIEKNKGRNNEISISSGYNDEIDSKTEPEPQQNTGGGEEIQEEHKGAKHRTNLSLICKQISFIGTPITVMITIGSIVVGITEGWNWIDSIYWCVITGTSVGYGDFSPKTESMKWFCVIFIPLSVGVISASLGKIANIFIEKEIAKSNDKLLKSELTLEDLERMNADGDGEVSVLEFVEFMLKSMNKVDQNLLDDLHRQFYALDADGSGGLQKEDLDILTEQKLNERRNIALEKYKNTFLGKGSVRLGGNTISPTD